MSWHSAEVTRRSLFRYGYIFYIVFTQTCDAQRMFQKSAYKTVVNALGG